jgi:hypothetical protein
MFYQIVNGDNDVLVECFKLKDIVSAWVDILDTIKSTGADITMINPSKACVNWLYPDNVTEYIQIIKLEY